MDCSEHLQRALDLAETLLQLAESPHQECSREECVLVDCVLRDCAYRIRAVVGQSEKEAQQRG